MSFKDSMVGILIAGLFAVAFLTFAAQTGINNGALDNILDDPSISGVNQSFYNNLTNTRTTADDKRTSVTGTEAQGGDDSFGLTTIPEMVWAFISLTFGTFKMFGVLVAGVFGVDPLIINILQGIIIMTLLIFGWRVIKGGGT